MKFNKKGLIIMLSLVTAFSTLLSACNSSSPNNSSSNASSTGNSTAAGVVPEGGAVINHLLLNTADNDYLPTIVTDFGKVNSNIKVNLIRVPWADFDTKFQTMVAGGTPPDVSASYASQSFAGFQSTDLLLDMTSQIKADNFKPADYGIDQNIYSSFTVDGKQYGIPFRSYVSVLAYNKDLFDKAKIDYPTSDYEDKTWTWDKLIEIGKKLTIISTNPAESQYGLTLNWTSPIPFIPMFGGKTVDELTYTNGGYPHTSYFDSAETISALQTLLDLAYKDNILIPPATAQALAGSAGDPFLAGKVAMTINGAWSIGGAKDLPFKMGIAAIPWYKDAKVRSNNYTDALFILKSSKVPNASYLWVKYQLTADVQNKVTQLSGNAPMSTSAMDTYYNFFPGISATDMKNVITGGIKYGQNAFDTTVVYSAQIETSIMNEWSPALIGDKQAKEIAPVIQQKIKDIIDKLNKENGK